MAVVGETRDAYRILKGKLLENEHLENGDVTISSTWISEKKVGG
jgi:hypothetical protein